MPRTRSIRRLEGTVSIRIRSGRVLLVGVLTCPVLHEVASLNRTKDKRGGKKNGIHALLWQSTSNRGSKVTWRQLKATPQ